MNQLVTNAIVLSRLNYGEADRIIKLITPEAGKISLMARGVRRQKSKLAGGIELFSVSSITYIKGRGDLGTLISARLDTYYDGIVKQIDRVQLGYDLIKILDRATEDEPEPAYFELLQQVFNDLNDHSIDVGVIRFWFNAQLVKLAGHEPNLMTDVEGSRLTVDQTYSFDFDAVSFTENSSGKFDADQIKFLRLVFAGAPAKSLQQIKDSATLVQVCMPLVQTMLTSYIRV